MINTKEELFRTICNASRLGTLWFVVHGWSMIMLGILCIIISVVGYVVPDIPLLWIVMLDAVAKIVFGAYLFFISKPSKWSLKEKAA